MKKTEIQSNVSLTMMNTSQFKDVTLTIRFLCKTDRKSVLVRTLLAQMLSDRCEKWPTKQALSNHLDNLYGAGVYTRGYNYGQCHAFEFRFKCLNDQYTNENTFERLFKTAHEFVFNPLKNGDLLDQECFEEAKRETIMSNARRMEQPQAKAVSSACALFGQGYPLAETQLITQEEIEAITCEEATTMLNHMLNQDAIMIFVIGKIDEELTRRYVERFFPFQGRSVSIESAYLIDKNDLAETEQTMKIDQTMLVMIFKTGINITSEDYWKLRVANGLFGQLPTSLLFQEVREKRSLCYSINSSALAYEGGLLITTGIQKSRLDETIDCILAQKKRMDCGDFEDEDLNTSINMLKNAIYGSYDDPISTLNFAFQNALLDRDETVEECVEAIESTTREDVMRIFKNMTHCVTFSLQQEEEHEETY